jgi:hypothetical protein
MPTEAVTGGTTGTGHVLLMEALGGSDLAMRENASSEVIGKGSADASSTTTAGTVTAAIATGAIMIAIMTGSAIAASGLST